jgi:hypothetical protein
MNPRVDFWQNPNSWPRDNSTHVFLARAVHQIGKAMFANGWTGEEGAIELYQTLPPVPGAAGGREYFAHDLLLRSRPDFNRAPLNWPRRFPDGSGFGSIPPTVKFTDEEWAAAIDLVKQNHSQNMPALTRFGRVTNEIATAAENEKILTAWRAKAGGDYREIPREHWNTERYSQRFDMCQIQPFSPFSLGSAGDLYAWIFVARGSLENYIHALNPPTAEARLPTTVKTEGNCRQWLETALLSEETAKWPKAKFKKEAEEKFGVGTRPFDRAWEQAIENTKSYDRRKAGAKPKLDQSGQ